MVMRRFLRVIGTGTFLLFFNLAFSQQFADALAICQEVVQGGIYVPPEDGFLTLGDREFMPCEVAQYVALDHASLLAILGSLDNNIKVAQEVLGLTSLEVIPNEHVRSPFGAASFLFVYEMMGDLHHLLSFTHVGPIKNGGERIVTFALYPLL